MWYYNSEREKIHYKLDVDISKIMETFNVNTDTFLLTFLTLGLEKESFERIFDTCLAKNRLSKWKPKRRPWYEHKRPFALSNGTSTNE